jgi:hypothetical protein
MISGMLRYLKKKLKGSSTNRRDIMAKRVGQMMRKSIQYAVFEEKYSICTKIKTE